MAALTTTAAEARSQEPRSIATAGGKRGWTIWTETRRTTTGLNAPSGERRETVAVSVLRLATFFPGASASRDGVACETAGLV